MKIPSSLSVLELKLPENNHKRIALGKKGRVRPTVLGIIILASGLMLNQWWWQIGAVLLCVVFIEGFYRYRSLD